MITVQAIDNNGEDLDHLHSIVVESEDFRADFDIQGLLTTLIGMTMEDL